MPRPSPASRRGIASSSAGRKIASSGAGPGIVSSGAAPLSSAHGAAVRARLDRVRRLLAHAVSLPAPPLLGDDAALRREAERLRPLVEEVAGRSYGRGPHVGFRRGLEARVAGPWSQYLTLGLGRSRIVRMTPLASSRPALPTILAHELAHRYGFDESVTTLRGLEVSARLAEAGDPAHAVAARLELARALLGAAMRDAVADADDAAAVDDLLAEPAFAAALARGRAHWHALRARGARRNWAATVYAALPTEAIERAATDGAQVSAPIPLPRFALDSAQAWLCAGLTRLDTVRRRETVPLGATLRLYRESGGSRSGENAG